MSESRIVFNDAAKDAGFLASLTQQELNSYYLSSGRLESDCSGDALFELYSSFHKAFIDGEAYTTKAIGVKVQPVRGTAPSNPVVSRNSACMESISEIAKNVSRLVFTSECGIEFKTTPFRGMGRLPEVKFISNMKEVSTLQSSAYLTQVTRDVSIVVVVSRDRCLQGVEKNYQRMVEMGVGSKGFFPFYTDHSMISDVKVLPFFGRHIFFRIEKDVDPEGVKRIWESRLIGGDSDGSRTAIQNFAS